MGKLVLAIVVGLVLFFVLGAARRAKRSAQDRTVPPAEAAATVRCAHCGIYLPADEGVKQGGRFYCCDEHRRLDQG